MYRFNKLLRKIPIVKHRIRQKDGRAHRFVVVIDCITNQNSRDLGAAIYPAMNWPVVQLCYQYDVAMLQMPCPEIAFLGFARNRAPGVSIREALNTPDGISCCRKIAIDVVDRIEQLLEQQAVFLAVLGGNSQSPGCAINRDCEPRQIPSGVLMIELTDELQQRNISVPFRAIRDAQSGLLNEDLQWLKQCFLKN